MSSSLSGYAVQVAPKLLKEGQPSLILRRLDDQGSFGPVVVAKCDVIDFGDGTGIKQIGTKAFAFTQFGGDVTCYRRGSVVFDGSQGGAVGSALDS